MEDILGAHGILQQHVDIVTAAMGNLGKRGWKQGM